MQNEQISPSSSYAAPVPAAGLWDRNASGVSWAAIFAGAAAAAALSLILIILGLGFGFSAISPWSSTGPSATAISISTAIWLAVTQIIASGLGGYLAGRLRVKWSDVHSDEIYFRDTAHGMLSWAVATLVTAAFLGSTLAAVVSGGAQVTSNIASSVAPMAQAATAAASGNAAEKDSPNGPLSYFVDSLFRSDQPTENESAGQTRGEAAVIFLNGVRTHNLDSSDKAYLGKLVARQTGLSQADAETRVADVYAKTEQAIKQAQTTAKDAADAARKAAAVTALWTFVALLCGAFFASLAAVYGGRQRDIVGPTSRR